MQLSVVGQDPREEGAWVAWKAVAVAEMMVCNMDRELKEGSGHRGERGGDEGAGFPRVGAQHDVARNALTDVRELDACVAGYGGTSGLVPKELGDMYGEHPLMKRGWPEKMGGEEGDGVKLSRWRRGGRMNRKGGGGEKAEPRGPRNWYKREFKLAVGKLSLLLGSNTIASEPVGPTFWSAN
ncbi:hypothetical protein BD779DRAFT_1162653 [Infundibulicybe gibba]|nr:hypothetical protein BD779DRAFT_1162653 [Infundibulicybe gibba]